MTGRGQTQPRWDIGDVLARTDLAALLDHLTQPATHQVRGRRWHCPIPDHDDHNASVTMHTDHHGHERWRCWSGDHTHRGDAIDLVTATRHLSRVEAIDWLADRAGMHPHQPLPAPAPRQPATRTPAVVALDPAVVRYAQACERILWTHSGQPVRDWLQARGFHDDILRANHVGADPGRHLMRRARGLPHGTSIAATFPALGPDGQIRYLQARYLDPGAGARYDNPAAALGTNPRLAWTRTPTSHVQPGILVVCEGIPDALTAAQAGYQSVAILGSQTPDHTVAVRLATHAERHHQHIVAILDADPAGRTCGRHLQLLLAEHGHRLHLIEPPDGLDLNEWARADAGWAIGLAVGALQPPVSRSLEQTATPPQLSVGLADPPMPC